MRKHSVSLITWLATAMVAFPQVGKPQALSASAPVQAKLAPAIALKQAQPFQTFTDLNGQMFGAGANTIAIIDPSGKTTRSFATGITRASISPHGSTALVVGDLDRKTVSTLDLKTGVISPLLRLSDIMDSSLPASGHAPGTHWLGQGSFSSVASDGKFVFVAMAAGFSSEILKIDPATKRIVASAWASASDPQAMVFQNGGLFVLVGNGSQVRRFSDTLQRSRNNIELQTTGAKGLGIRSGEILALQKGQIIRAAVPAAELETTSILRNIDRHLVAQAKVRPQWKWPLNLSKRVAVLITGDLAENFWGECFWNDTVWMYKTLLANGYTPADIFVLYGDGNDYASANPTYRHPTRVTDYAATNGNVFMVFDGLKNGDAARGIPKLDSNDTLFVWTFDHGGRSGSESTLCLRDGAMGASAFSTRLNAVTYARRAVFMQQCFSGGFIDPLKNAKTFISTAARPDQVAYPADTENETFGGRPYSHGEYNYWITSALNRLTPTGAGVNADANADAWVSMAEMHAWEAAHKSTSETPQSNDMGGVGGSFRMKK